MIAVGIKLELPLLYWLLNWTPIPAVRRLMRVADRLRDAGYKAVENTKRASQEGFKTLFSKMYPEDGTQPFSDDLMADEASNIIIAGTDTTAMTLTYLVYEVLQNPGIKTKLLKELEPCSADPRVGELEEKQYLNNVIQETLRLHSAVPASLPRTVPAEVLCLEVTIFLQDILCPPKHILCTAIRTFGQILRSEKQFPGTTSHLH